MRGSVQGWTVAAISFGLGIVGPGPVFGQAEQTGRIALRIVSSTAAPPVEAEARRVLIRGAKEARVGVLSGAGGRRTLVLPDRARVALPMDLPALVARDGSLVVQVGDPVDLAHPTATNLYWVTPAGELLRSLEKYFAGHALVACSDDGYVAVAGKRFDSRGADVLCLFNPKGERVWERPVGSGRAIRADPVVAAHGRRVAATTTDGGNPLRDHRVLVVDERGNDLGSIDAQGVIQRIAIAGNGNSLFVQGQTKHGLVDLAVAKLLWLNEGNVRLVSPNGAGASPDGRVLFLMLADWRGRPQEKYRWRLQALDAVNGRELGSLNLPEEVPGTPEDIYTRITNERVGVLAGSTSLSIAWSR